MGKKNKKLSQEKLDYIKEHRNDRPRKMYAKEIGVSISVFRKYAKEFGGDVREMAIGGYIPKHHRYVIEHYADASTVEIAKSLSLTRSAIDSIARKYGLKHSDEQIRRAKERQRELFKKNRDLYVEKRVKAWKLTRRMDELRLLSGERQRSRMNISLVPERIKVAMYRLRYRRGYIKCETDPYLLYYDENTRRTTLRRNGWTEEKYEKKYKIKFKELPKDEEYDEDYDEEYDEDYSES